MKNFAIHDVKACGIMNSGVEVKADEFFNKTDNYFCLGNEKKLSLLFSVARYTAKKRLLKRKQKKRSHGRQSKYVEL